MRAQAFAFGLFALSCLFGPAAANESVKRAAANPANWVLQTGDYANHRYSPMDQINRENVKNLQVAWQFSTGVLRGHEGGPLVVGDVMYVHTPFPNNVYALDLTRDGRTLWVYKPEQDPSVVAVLCCDTVNRGLAYAEGLLFLHQADTTLVALDARNGKEVWKTVNGDPTKGETNTATVMPVKDKVIVGIAGGEFGVQCHLTAYDIRSGKRMWRAYSVGPDEQILFDPKRTTSLGKPVGRDSSIKTWMGDQWRIGGGCTWGWFAYDPDLDLLYYGTANPSTWNPTQRPGDNKWAQSIIAREVDTGVARWAYQMTPFDEWDYDGANEMILADIDVKGEPRKALVHFDRNGLAYTMDRATGELLVAEKYDPKVNWTEGVEMDKTKPNYGRPYVVDQYSPARNGAEVNTRSICPAALGSKDQAQATFSPKAGLFFAPTNHVCMDYEPFKVEYTAGQPYVGARLSMFAAPESHGGLGNFIAWDASEGRIVWSKPELFAVWSGALSTAGDIVFYGTLDGYLKALDTRDGTELFKFKTPSGIIGGVMTYQHRGKQYVAVLSGVGGWAGIGLAAGLTNPSDGAGAVGGFEALRQYTAIGGTLTVFALP